MRIGRSTRAALTRRARDFPHRLCIFQRRRPDECSATARDVRRVVLITKDTKDTKVRDLLAFLCVLCVHGGVSAFEQAARNWKRLCVRDASARRLPDPPASVLLRSEDTMLGTYLMALFAMLFAAASALTLIHFVGRLDTRAPEVPAESPKVETAAAA
jgi:hypothetical protein